MSVVTVQVSDLTSAFPQFSDETIYPSSLIQNFITQAECYISTTNYQITPEQRILLIELMACHLMTLNNIVNGEVTGMNNTGVVQSSSIGDVSVSLVPPIAKDAFELWIQSTPYGQQYWALLTALNPTGIYWIGCPRPFGVR